MNTQPGSGHERKRKKKIHILLSPPLALSATHQSIALTPLFSNPGWPRQQDSHRPIPQSPLISHLMLHYPPPRVPLPYIPTSYSAYHAFSSLPHPLLCTRVSLSFPIHSMRPNRSRLFPFDPSGYICFYIVFPRPIQVTPQTVDFHYMLGPITDAK